MYVRPEIKNRSVQGSIWEAFERRHVVQDP
jgi:hypothetical protein